MCVRTTYIHIQIYLYLTLLTDELTIAMDAFEKERQRATQGKAVTMPYVIYVYMYRSTFYVSLCMYVYVYM